MKHKIVLISNFCDPTSDSNDRICSVYDYWLGDKIIISSNFDHGHKKYIKKLDSSRNYIQISVPSYSRNLSFKRLYSHFVFSQRLKKELKKTKDVPDYIYCAMPTTMSAFVCMRFCKKHHIKFVIDVIDLWPDSLIALTPVPNLFKFLVYPGLWLTRKVYANADIIIAESKEYEKEAKKYNEKAPSAHFYLGIDTDKVNQLIKNGKTVIPQKNEDIWLCYGGSLGNSYDFDEIFKILFQLKGNNIDYKFFFVGGGVLENSIQEKIIKYNLPAYITGRIDYDEYLYYLSHCDIAFNFFKKNTKVVHSYKFNDYLAVGLCIINNLSGETWEMVDGFRLGINYNANYKQIEELVLDKKNLAEIKSNSLKFSDANLNKRIIYPELARFIINS